MALTPQQTEMIKIATRLALAATTGRDPDADHEAEKAAQQQDVIALGLGVMKELFELKNAIVTLAEKRGGLRIDPKESRR